MATSLKDSVPAQDFSVLTLHRACSLNTTAHPSIPPTPRPVSSLCYSLPSFQAVPPFPVSSPASCATCAFSQPLLFLPPIHPSVHVFFHLLPIVPHSHSRHCPWISFFPTVHPLSSVPYPFFHAAQHVPHAGRPREVQGATPRGRAGCVRWNLRNLGGKKPQGGNGRAVHLLSCMDLQVHTLYSHGQLWPVSEPKVPELNLSPTRPERLGCVGGQLPGSLGQGTGWAQIRGAVLQAFHRWSASQKSVQVILALFCCYFGTRSLYVAQASL